MKPLAYFITFTTYGSWLHGDKSGSIEKEKSESSATLLGTNRGLELYEKSLLKNPSFIINTDQQGIVLSAILDVCKARKWDA